MKTGEKRALLILYLLLFAWAFVYIDAVHLTPMPYTSVAPATAKDC